MTTDQLMQNYPAITEVINIAHSVQAWDYDTLDDFLAYGINNEELISAFNDEITDDEVAQDYFNRYMPKDWGTQ